MPNTKPATDCEIHEWRHRWHSMNGFHSSSLERAAGSLIARIDKERAALGVMTQRLNEECAAHALAHKQWSDMRAERDAERARAERTEAALRGFLAAHDFAGAESWDCTGETRQRFEHAASAAKLLLEEPTNG